MKGTGPLNLKQEDFCQIYVSTGKCGFSYDTAFGCTRAGKSPSSIASASTRLLRQPNVKERVQEIQNQIAERNNIAIDELISDLARMIRFDPADIYDDAGALLPIRQISRPVRQMISSLDVEELYIGKGKDRENYGCIKKVKLFSKLDAIEKLMKYLGAYEKDNTQKAPIIQYENVSKQYPDGHLKIVKKSG